MRMTIVKGNFRPDIELIYDEVGLQLKKNRWEQSTFIPFATKRTNGTGNISDLTRGLLAAMTRLSLIHRAWKVRSIFFESNRLRLWRLVDFFLFNHHIDVSKPDAVFILNRKHSAGAVLAAQQRNIPVITHQHGDYYNDRVHLSLPFRDAEGPDTIRLVWDNDSLRLIREFSPSGEFVPSGSLKFAAIQRRINRKPFKAGIVFFETIFVDIEKDRNVTDQVSKVLAEVSIQTKQQIFVGLHPIRKAKPDIYRYEETLKKYCDLGIKVWTDGPQDAEWAICSDSNALFDAVVAGVPCIHLKRTDSVLSIKDEYPGTVHVGNANPSSAIARIISASNRDTIAQEQLEFLQSHKIGSPETVDAAFALVLGEIEETGTFSTD